MNRSAALRDCFRAWLCNTVCCAVSTDFNKRCTPRMCYCSPADHEARTATPRTETNRRLPDAARGALRPRATEPQSARADRAILDNHEEAYFPVIARAREALQRRRRHGRSRHPGPRLRTLRGLRGDLREHFVRQITPYGAQGGDAEAASVADHVDGGLERDTENLRVLKSSLQGSASSSWRRSCTARGAFWSSAWIWRRRSRGFSRTD